MICRILLLLSVVPHYDVQARKSLSRMEKKVKRTIALSMLPLSGHYHDVVFYKLLVMFAPICRENILPFNELNQ